MEKIKEKSLRMKKFEKNKKLEKIKALYDFIISLSAVFAKLSEWLECNF